MPAKPSVYDELYPSRFLKAGLFKGLKPTLTITDVDHEDLVGDDGKPKMKVILSFKERPMQHVLPKTNALCLKAMFGPNLKDWIGKRVTLFAGNWNGEEAIRVWGSPDIDRDINVTISLPRRKPFDMMMHAIRQKSGKEATKGLDPRVTAAMDILDWTETEKADFLASGTDLAEMLRQLNAQIDARNAVE